MKAMHKRILVLLTAMLLVVGLLGMTALAAQNDPADEPVCYEHGDINGDGKVDRLDAVRLLFHVMFPNNPTYSVNQSCDFEVSGAEDRQDVLFLLFAWMGMGNKTLEGTIHNYYDPVWSWDTDGAAPTASVSLKCACGQAHTITEGIAVTAGTVVEATCVADGSKEYTGKVSYEGKDYENTLTVTLPALGENGHTINGEPTCTQGVKCEYCDYTEPALGHTYVASDEKVEDCKHTLMQKCACGAELEGEVYYTHTYSPISLVEATCSADGKQISKCACGHVQEDTILANKAFHDWNEGVKEGGVTTYTCKHNASHTKTVVEMSNEGVSAKDMKENEVQLDGGASVSLGDNALSNVAEDASVVIEVSPVNKDELALDPAQLKQIGDATVYDFSMTVGGQEVETFGGKITVSLPYTLQAGDDVNDIDVWFIDDNGNVTSHQGVYNNGFVTFETNHFSYYTVTRMAPAERCARYTHNMVERSKDATCTEDGYHKIFCLRCGEEEKNEVKEMLGHDYQKDAEQSVDATCDAAGKLVSICANCSHKRIQEVKQLKHEWAMETVAPTCSAKGYDLYTCELCKAEKVLNEKEALGHKYPEALAQWTWNSDNSKASVTLVCENDQTHTKVLSAVVTAKGGNACVGGQVTYTAVASYNKVNYTATATGEQAGAGHTPDTEWASDNDKHYHTCTVCGEPVGKADHDWERTVTKAATCDKDGTATDTCSVCGKEKAVVLPATGKHTFVKGTCSVCGYKEGSCDHKTLTEVKYNLADYGACEGYITVRSCACGEKTVWMDSELSCDFVDTENVDEDSYYAEYTSTCKVCGLKGVGVQSVVIDEDACVGYYQIRRTFTKGDTVIIDNKEKSEDYSHPVVVKHEPVNLADYGLCAMVVTRTSCPCGLNSRLETEGDGCQMDSQDGENFSCSVCGATAKTNQSSKKEGCVTIKEATVTFYKNGAQVISFTECHVETVHTYKLVSYELLGESCEDGVTINRLCTVCGKTYEGVNYGCSTILVEKTIDTSATDSCATAIEIRTCPCGAYKDWYYVFGGEAEDHEWDYEWDPETGMGYEFCAVCGFTVTAENSEIDPATKDENCQVHYTRSYTYYNDKGQEFTWEIPARRTYHDSTYTTELLGESCKDGVKITEVCPDCGMEETWTTNYHESYPIKKLDLSQHGFCGRIVYLYSCACGEYSSTEFDTYDCNWVDTAGDEGFYERMCEICGIVWQTRWEETDSDESCAILCNYTDTFLLDGEVLGEFNYVQKEYNHRYVYELTLDEGAESCGDGYTYVATCLECGKTYEDWGRGCSTYEVARERIDGMCGQAEVVTETCACGKYGQTSVVWYGEEACDFYSGESVYNEEYGAGQYFCAGCGASRIRVREDLPVEGEPCKYESRTTQYYLDAEGKEICQTVYSGTYSSHDWLCDYTLLGKTCDDGWTGTLVCLECGETDAFEDVEYGCSYGTVERELVYDAEDICGPVYLYKSSCACGREVDLNLRMDCDTYWEGSYEVCSNCDLKYMYDTDHEPIPGTCREKVTRRYEFFNKGQSVATVTEEYEVDNHVDVYELILLGETCEDGYKVVQKCAYCDYEDEFGGLYYSHRTWVTERYDFPAESCGAGVYIEACACGKYYSVHDDSVCRWETVSEETVDGDDNHYINTKVCNHCGMTRVRDWYFTVEDCYTTTHANFKWTLGDWELSLSEHSTEANHSWKGISAELEKNAQTCDDGVQVTVQCTRCGEWERWGTTSHFTVADPNGTIDLSQYGAVCGAKLELMSCACGLEKGYAFSEDTECDIGYNNIDHWIEGVLDESYYTTNGWESVWSSSYERFCAVTNPQCGLKMRMAEYWVNENCQAVRYETWQLGYDPETDTCQREITIATGEVRPFHPYELVSETDNTADGVRTVERKKVCPDCGSSWTETYLYDVETGSLLKNVRKVVSTLNNNWNKEYTQIQEYVILKDMFGFTSTRDSLYRNEYVYPDGSTYWYQNAYTYDIAGGCKCTRVYSDSMGEYGVYENEMGHSGHQIAETVKNPTCTQSGICHVEVVCRYCEQTLEERNEEILPNDHSWDWDSEKGLYRCSECGVENTNGASGVIWMEDMSDETYYIVGYYDRHDIGFNPYVSLILYDAAEDEQDELVLESIVVSYLTQENDGIRGLRFDKAATAEAAAAALEAAGYTGSYAVRISCVPMNGSTALDYAVTFDTLIAE